MKLRINKIITDIVILIAIICVGIVNVSAVDKVKINGNEYNTGDTITYIVQLKTDMTLSGVNATVEYPSKSLELDKESVNIPDLGSMVIANTDDDGEIRFVATDIQNGFDFSQGKLVLTATFKIKENAENGDIKITFTEATDMEISDAEIDYNDVTQIVQEGEYDGSIINPDNGEKYIDNDTSDGIEIEDVSDTDNKNVIIIVTLIVAVVLIATASFIVSRKNKKEKNQNV